MSRTHTYTCILLLSGASTNVQTFPAVGHIKLAHQEADLVRNRIFFSKSHIAADSRICLSFFGISFLQSSGSCLLWYVWKMCIFFKERSTFWPHAERIYIFSFGTSLGSLEAGSEKSLLFHPLTLCWNI